MKLLKILLAIVIVLLFVVLFIIGGAYIFLDPNRLKPVIIEAVKKQGYELTIDDKIEWSLFPKIGIHIKHMTMSAPANPPFLDVSDVKITSELSQVIYRGEKITAEIRAKTVRLLRLHMTDAFIQLGWENNILTLHPINTSLYDGTLTGIMHGRELTTSPKWDWSWKLDRIQVKKLLADVAEKNSRVTLSGIAELRLSSTSKGRGGDTIASHATGTNQFTIRDGVLEGIDINYLIQTADALINKQPISPPPLVQQTPFDTISGTAAFTEGLANIYALISSKTFTAQTNGNFNIATRDVDLSMKIATQNTIKTQWEIPVLITGKVYDPNVRLDMAEIQKRITAAQIDKVKDVVKDKIEKVKDEIKTHIPGKAGEYLQNLIGR